MNKRIVLFFSTVITCMSVAFAQIPDKTYEIGDTIVIDGICSLVIKTDASGKHGKAMSPQAIDAKKAEKNAKQMVKLWSPRVKKGKRTQEELDAEISYANARARIPELTPSHGLAKNSKSIDYATWRAQVPQIWRLPNESDCDDIVNMLHGRQKVKDANNSIYDVIFSPNELKQTLTDIEKFGILCYKNDDVKFFYQLYKTYKIREEYKGHERTVVVADF